MANKKPAIIVETPKTPTVYKEGHIFVTFTGNGCQYDDYRENVSSMHVVVKEFSVGDFMAILAGEIMSIKDLSKDALDFSKFMPLLEKAGYIKRTTWEEIHI
jgi:hypothetical protein